MVSHANPNTAIILFVRGDAMEALIYRNDQVGSTKIMLLEMLSMTLNIFQHSFPVLSWTFLMLSTIFLRDNNRCNNILVNTL